MLRVLRRGIRSGSGRSGGAPFGDPNQVDRGPGCPPGGLGENLRAVLPGAPDTITRVGAWPGDRTRVRRGERRPSSGRVRGGQGTTFVVELPLPSSAPDSRGTYWQHAVSGGSVTRARLRRRAADPPGLKVILRDGGFEVTTAATAKEALDSAAVGRPDAAILDLVLPDGDGVEVMPHSSGSGADADHRPFSGRRGAAEGPGPRSGCRRLRHQAVRAHELVARLEATLRRVAPRPMSPFSAQTASSSTWRATPFDSAATTFISRPSSSSSCGSDGKPGSADDARRLPNQVWGPAYVDDVATLRTHMANLRRKVESQGSPIQIRTETGIGYRFAS